MSSSWESCTGSRHSRMSFRFVLEGEVPSGHDPPRVAALQACVQFNMGFETGRRNLRFVVVAWKVLQGSRGR